MSGIADGLRIPITCPKCSEKFEESLARLQTNPTLSCPSCGVSIQFDSGGALDEPTRALDDFERAIRDFNK